MYRQTVFPDIAGFNRSYYGNRWQVHGWIAFKVTCVCNEFYGSKSDWLISTNKHNFGT